MPKSHEKDEAFVATQRREMGRRIRAARVKAGFSRAKDFAAAVGVTPPTLSGWEKGHYSPSLENLNRISKLTGERTSYLNPQWRTGATSFEALGRELGTVLGSARLQKLLELPHNRLRKEIDSVLGSYLVSTIEVRSGRKRRGR